LLVKLIAAASALAFVLRSSVLASLASDSVSQQLSYITIGSLFVMAAYALVDGIGRIQWLGLLLIAATAASLWHCERFEFALSRWIGWAMLLVVLGPVRSTLRARQLRARMAENVFALFTAVVVLSAAWRIAELPVFGRGIFCGVMAHSMILGPIAGLVGIRALVRIVDRGSPSAWGLYIASLYVCALASSRAALAALIVGSLAIMGLRWKRHPLIAAVSIAFIGVFLAAPTATMDLLGTVLPQQLTVGLQQKSWDNTRELHWEARWEEFTASPVTGVGFAAAWTDTVGVDAETGAVETGSSYLAILSMTGIVGAAACLILIGNTCWRVFRHRRRLTRQQQLEFWSMGAFWAVHLGAEGYIYAVSSLLGLTFWLWLGQVHDQLAVARRPMRNRLKRTGGVARPDALRRAWRLAQ
jgi:O-antigen ligase